MAFFQRQAFIGLKLEKDDADTFATKAGGRGKQSEVLRELIKMFNAGKIKVIMTKVVGG